jgi:UDP-2,4-diacetamido-2,4,6-trideoxy-beta-L-altropyranose hydrolase/UDP-4-amino-4,6-dideoxy-N-acetyl-beta-L-altrosamine N-acetyltransferase
MKNKTILFRANSSSTIGTGHIMRDLVLVKQYKESEIIFATQELQGNINYKIAEAGYKIELLEDNSMEKFQKVVDKYHPILVIIDSYDIDYSFEQKLKNQNPKLKLMVVDDSYERHYCDILINHNVSGDTNKYRGLVPSNCELRCGAEYTLLRDEFHQAKKSKTVFIAMGGTDYGNLNISILEVLAKFDNLNVIILTTVANPYLKELERYVEDKEWIELHINSNRVATLMKISDFAIVTPSVTVNEVYFMELALIAITVAPNQKDMEEYLKKSGHLVIDSFSSEKLESYIEEILKPKLVNFTELSLHEKKMILEWRNSKEIRRWMYTDELISLKNHLSYIDSLDSREDRVYFLVKDGDRAIGVIDFTSIDYKKNQADIGLYARPNERGIGTTLMKIIIEYGFNILIAEVLKENHRAIRLYKKFGFIEKSRRDNMIIMERKHENR